ncbi:MFS transporter [Actinoplanes sp. NPDC000266]
MFIVAGAAIGTWTARIPAIMHGLAMSDGQLSIALVVLAAGGLAGMGGSGRLVDRFGSRQVLAPAMALVGGALVGLAYAPTLPTLLGALFVFGAIHGTLNVAMNAHAVECQRAYGRPIMTSFHAFFSIGGVVGALTGGAFAHAGHGPAATFLTIGAASTMLAVAAIRWALPSESPKSTQQRPSLVDASPPTSRFPWPQVLLLGLLAFCSLTSEGAAADWGSMYLHDSLGSSSATAAAAYAVFAATMTIGRLTGDRLLARLGPVRLLRASSLIAALGLAAGLLAHHPVAALAGFAVLGAGLSCVVPQVYSAAGTLNGEHTGRILSYVAALGYLGFVGGPALIGGLADLVGLARAMFILPMLLLIIAATASVVHRPRSAHQQPRGLHASDAGTVDQRETPIRHRPRPPARPAQTADPTGPAVPSPAVARRSHERSIRAARDVHRLLAS